VRTFFAVLVMSLFVAAPVAAQVPQQPGGDVDIILILEITDTAGWVILQEEALVTPQPGPRPLSVSVAATTGGRRSISLAQPRFELAMIKGIASFKVTVHGKMGISEAVGALGAFEQALIEQQAPPGDSGVGLQYGLTTVSARMLEMYVTRP
jgi:hypothetical protein